MKVTTSPAWAWTSWGLKMVLALEVVLPPTVMLICAAWAAAAASCRTRSNGEHAPSRPSIYTIKARVLTAATRRRAANILYRNVQKRRDSEKKVRKAEEEEEEDGTRGGREGRRWGGWFLRRVA